MGRKAQHERKEQGTCDVTLHGFEQFGKAQWCGLGYRLPSRVLMGSPCIEHLLHNISDSHDGLAAGAKVAGDSCNRIPCP